MNSTFARREREKILLSANWALLNHSCWLLAKALPGNLESSKAWMEKCRWRKKSIEGFRRRMDVPLSGSECEGHANQVIPLGVGEILWRQWSTGPSHLLITVACWEWFIQFSQLLAPLKTHLICFKFYRLSCLPRLYITIVVSITPWQHTT